MITFSNAKINLGLRVIGKLPNGYHQIETLLYPVAWCDMIEILPAEKNEIQFTGNPIQGKIKNNTVFKAYKLLEETGLIKQNIKIHLHKVIPVGSGLGGGSSNAAFTLSMLNKLFELGLSDSELKFFAGNIGSDCPFFIENTAQLAAGTGNELEPTNFSLKGKYVIIIFPGITVSTKIAYQNITPNSDDTSIMQTLKSDMSYWKGNLKNDFEPYLSSKEPVIPKIKNTLYQLGAFYASLTGSGSAVYGLFDFPAELSKDFSNFVCWSGILE